MSKTVAMVVGNGTNLGKLCRVRDFEDSGKHDMIGFDLHGNWLLAHRVHFKILKVRRTVNV